MAKKLIRLHHPTTSQINDLVGKEMNLILRDKAVYFGDLLSVKNDLLIFRDKIRNKHKFPVQDILEITLDAKHSF